MADYISQFTGPQIDARLAKVSQLETGKQDKLVSGTNIKTLNGESILGSGDITIQGGDPNAVKYTAQTLTDAQKAQARTNIAAASAADIDSLEAAVQAINVGDYVTATTLPTAAASTMGHIYLIGPDANNNYDRYFTQESGGTYSWVSLGSTQIDLSTYATKEEVTQLEHKVSGNLMSTRAKNALLAVFNKVAFAVPDVSAEMSELNNALFNLDDVTGINAVYTQGSTVIWSDGVSVLNDLKAGLVVKAEYGDGTEVAVYDYTLSGTLTPGTSVITVEYEGFTTTFNVTVTQFGTKMSYTMALGEVNMYSGYPSGGSDGYGFLSLGSTTRKGFALSYGKTKCKDENGNDTNYYAIPVPLTATRVTLQVTAATLQVAIRSAYLHNGRYYNSYNYSLTATATINPGWWTGSGSYELSNAPNNREELYILVNCKLSSGNNFTDNNKPTNLVITFE